MLLVEDNDCDEDQNSKMHVLNALRKSMQRQQSQTEIAVAAS